MQRYFIGVMSGTSLDGIDVALVSSAPNQFEMFATHFLPYPDAIKTRLLVLHEPSHNELEDAQRISNELACLYAEAILALLEKSQLSASAITAIGCHGQTIRHRPELGFTVQLGNYALLAELTGISVVGDFRSRDIAAGGQGAPLVPAFHQAMYASPKHNRAIVNIGGIANITYLAKDGSVMGFDSGPGNMLIDQLTKQTIGQDYDADGAWAATGMVLDVLLSDMLAEPYFALSAPKSTGRDLFNAAWVKQHSLYLHLKPQDLGRTLVALTAHSIHAAISSCGEIDDIYCCGGGAHNSLLMADLQTLLGDVPVKTTEAFGIGVDWVEAVAFAWLAQQTIDQQPSNLPAATGAKGPRVLGAIYPG
jgi:anhydro-N-acetylmuramic acid kinase